MVNYFVKKTQFVEGEGLKIPVIDLSLGEGGKSLSEPETLRNSILELLFEPEELESLVIVKLDKQDESLDPLAKVRFEDGIARRVAFSSGNNVYFADAQLSQKLIQFFETQKDHACRYGSLLISSCNEGASLIDGVQDNKPLRIKIVDFESEDPKERAEAQQFRTGDCHGKISPRLATMLGGKQNCPFQFRFAWMQQWTTENSNTPDVSFLAKGTFLPDKNLTDKKGYDLILDRSSIKGIAEDQLEQSIPCSDYQLPKAVIGNRGNAKIQEYENSWQFLIWYSQAAIQKDIVPLTQAEANRLAQLQKDPIKLARYIVEQYDKKTAFAAQTKDEATNANREEEQPQRSESRLISLLRNDKYGQLLDFPKVADFMRTQVAKRWRDLAIKGAVRHGSAMAQPGDDLKPGTIVAPHLKNGEEVIVTRYPIVSKDNIRRYTVDNSQKTELNRYRGCVFIRPDQAMEHHQCDFDGDQLVVTPASRLPHIAAQTRHANEEREFDPVQKRQKIDYTEVRDERGNRKYTKLRQIAAGIPRNQIGRVATLIGRVQSSVPKPEQPRRSFEQSQRKLLGKLFDALQIEVDSPKSATRLEDRHPTLLSETRDWTQQHPSYLFDFKNDERLYKTLPMPIEGGNAINAIALYAVNPIWEPARLRSRHRDEFRYLFEPPDDPQKRKQWEKYYLPWAQDLKERTFERGREIRARHSNEADAIKEDYGKLYEDLRGEIAEAFPSCTERKLAAAALWYVETTSPNLNEPRRECAKLSRHLNITFHLEKDYQRLGEALPKNTYILTVPFEQYNKNQKGQDLAGTWKEALDRKGIQYEATLDPNLPLVRFALIAPSDKLIETLETNFGGNDNFHISNDALNYRNGLGEVKPLRIVPPTDYHWLEATEDLTPKSALALNLFAEEICAQLQHYQFDRAELIGQKYNDFKDEDFGTKKWQGKKVKLSVGALDKPDDCRHGFPIVQLDGKNLAMFSVNSPKLPIGVTFEATICPAARGSALSLDIDPISVQISEPERESRSHPKLNININVSRDREAKERQSRSHLDSRPFNASAPKADETSQVLHAAIAQCYAQHNQAKFRMTQEWTAFINSHTQDCFVRDKQRKIIFSSNLKNHRITQPLSQQNSQAYTETIRQLNSPEKELTQKAQQL